MEDLVDYSDDDYSQDEDMKMDDNPRSMNMDLNSCSMMMHENRTNSTILKEQDIRYRQQKAITGVSTLLQVSKETACLLLLHYNWDVETVSHEWFSDQENVCKTVGIILDKSKISFPTNEQLSCGNCLEKYASQRLHSVGCEHLFCDSCWTSYISNTINYYGPVCLHLWCPRPGCAAAVGPDMVDKFVTDEDKAKYDQFLVRSYESSHMIKWCPAPGCDSAVEFGFEKRDVICDCFYKFCWNCKEEDHQPLDCETAAKWNMKNSVESENTAWILANTKPCPMCKRPIENCCGDGWNRMMCATPCGFEFCWLCLDSWPEGVYHSCSKEPQLSLANMYLEKYPYYYENWASNNALMQKALQDLNEIKRVHSKKIDEVQCQDDVRPMFITEAWQQIVECTRVLKWSCANDYYNLSEQELQRRKLSFRDLQYEARSYLESLQFNALKELTELMTYIKDNKASDVKQYHQFYDIRKNLVCLTSVARTHIDYFLRMLENGPAAKPESF